MRDLEVPHAITAITQEEEAWRVTRIQELNNRIFEVGRVVLPSGVAFYQRECEGKTVAHMSGLSRAKRRLITHKDALDMRLRLDAQWSARSVLKGMVAQLWETGRLKEYGKTVGGVFCVEDDIDDELPRYTLLVESDGALELRIDNPNLSGENGPLDWHEYYLPKGTSDCVRRLPRPDGSVESRVVINGNDITRYFTDKLITAANLSANLAA